MNSLWKGQQAAFSVFFHHPNASVIYSLYYIAGNAYGDVFIKKGEDRYHRTSRLHNNKTKGRDQPLNRLKKGLSTITMI